MSNPLRASAVIPSALLLTLALTACGGGGGSASGGSSSMASPTAGAETTPATSTTPAAPAPVSPAPAPAPAPAPSAPTPGDTVVCSPGDAPSVRSAAFSLVNIVRTALGLSQLVRPAAFDAVAQAHAQYVVANGSASIEESPGLPCFTGAELADRLTGAGLVAAEFPGTRPRSELVIAYSTPAGAELQPWDLINDTLNTLYGRMFLLDPRSQQVGLGFSANPSGAQRAMVLDTALLPVGAETVPATWVVWPRDGAGGLPTSMRTSNLKPLDAGITEGYPISVHATAPVQISRFVLTTASTGAPVTATLVTNANDRHGYLTTGEAALVPNAPLAAGVTYRVELEGTVGATPVRAVWTFTTAS